MKIVVTITPNGCRIEEIVASSTRDGLAAMRLLDKLREPLAELDRAVRLFATQARCARLRPSSPKSRKKRPKVAPCG